MNTNTPFPLLTSTLAARIESTSIAFWIEKLTALRNLPNNPWGVSIRTFGHATVLITQRARDNGLFNRVGNLRPDDIEHLDAIIAQFRAHNVPCRFDITHTLPRIPQPRRNPINRQ